MPRHGNRIRKRKDGRWEGRYKVGNYDNGKTKYLSVYGKSFAEVKHKLSLKDKNNSDLSEKPSDKIFSFVVEQWLMTNKYKFKKSTVRRYECIINSHIIPDLGNVKLSAISVITLNNFAEYKLNCGGITSQKGLSKSYVRSIMLVINSVINFAVNEGWCEALKSEIYKPSPEKKDLKILTSEAQISLENNLFNDFSPTAAGMLITLQTGLRIGEVCSLKWENIDFDNKILYIRSTISRINNPDGETPKTVLTIDKPKTSASVRDIPFSDKLCDYLKEVKMRSVSPFVASSCENFVSTRTFDYRYHKIMELYSTERVNYHALRHSFATRCIEYGVDIKSLSEILGHANPSVTLNTYVHSSIELKRSQLSKIFGDFT